MKALFTALLLAAASLPVHSQTLITGIVVDNKGEPVPGANILIEGSYDGTSSGADGSFSFETHEQGERVLAVKFVGYTTHHQNFQLQDRTIRINVTIHEEASQLEAVTINAGSFAADDVSRRTVFRPLDIATTAGATADIAGALNTLPGTQKVGETGRLFVRGGDGSEARTFIDGMVVLNAYSPSSPNAPSRGRFLPFMFKGISFSTGGYSAEYGQALSSALVLESKDEAETIRTDIGILSVGADVAHTHSWDRGSVAGKIQYTNIRPYFGLMNQEVDWKKAPASIEGVAAFRQKVGKDGMLKVYGNFNESNFSLYQHDIDNYDIRYLYDLRNRYSYLNGSYKSSLNEKWALKSGASYNFSQNDLSVDENSILETEKGFHAKAVVDGELSRNIDVKGGAEILHRSYAQELISLRNAFRFDENILSLFVESDVRIGNSFVARVGGRSENNNLAEFFALDPRMSLAWRIKRDGQLSFAYGKFRQTAKNDFLRIRRSLKSEKAEHFILNYQYLKERKTFRIEAYYKKYNDLVKISGVNFNNDGTGYARGFELFWRDNSTFRGVDYWISYSYLDTERDYIDFPSMAVPSFASKHNVSVVGKYFIRSIRSQIGATWSYASGRPYNNPNQDTFNSSTTPFYQDVSINLSYLPKPHLILYLSCSNVFGRNNIFGYEFSDKRNEHDMYNGRAIRQPAPRFLFVGFFITLSKNKSVNQLPSL